MKNERNGADRLAPAGSAQQSTQDFILPPLTATDEEAWERQFSANALVEIAEVEGRLIGERKSFRWILGRRPDAAGALPWLGTMFNDPLPRDDFDEIPRHLERRVSFDFRMPGGVAEDRLRVVVQIVAQRALFNPGKWTVSFPHVTAVQAWAAGRRYSGGIVELHREMSDDALWFLGRDIPDAVIDRATAVMRGLTEGNPYDPLNVLARLAPRLRCCYCERPLRDPASKVLGIGPDCARHAGIPHGDTAARRVLDLRAGVPSCQ